MKDDARSTLEKVNQMFPELKGYESIERVSTQISSMSGEDSDIFKDIKNQIQKLKESDVKALTGLMRQIKNNQKVFEEQLKVCGYEAALMSDDYQLIISRYNECLTLLQKRLTILDVCMPDDLNLLALPVVMALPVSGASRAREYRCNPLKGSTLQAEASVVEDHDGQGFSFQGFSGRFDECFPRHERWLSTILTEQYNKVYEREGPCSDRDVKDLNRDVKDLNRDVKDLIQCYHTGISNLFEEHQFYLNQSGSQARFLKRRLSEYLGDMRDKINQILDLPQLSLLNDHKAGFQFVILRMFNEHNDMAKCFQANIKASLPSEDRPSKRARASVEHFNHSHSIGIQPVIQACLCFDDFGTPCSEMGVLVSKLKSTVRASLSESDPQRLLLFCLLKGLSDKITRLKCPDDLKVELDQFNKIHTMSPTHNNFGDMLFKIDTLWNQWLDIIDLTHHKDALLEFKKAYTAIDSVISEQLKHLDRSSEDYHSCKKIGEDFKQSVRECCDYLKALLPKKAKDQKTEAITVPSKRAQSDESSNLDALKGVNKRGTPEVQGNKRRSVMSGKGRRFRAQKVEIPVAVRSHPPSSYALKGHNKKQGQPVLEKGQPILENSNAISNAIERRVFDPAVHWLVELSQSYTKSSQLKDLVSSSLPQLSVVLGPDKASRLIRPTTILGSLVQAPDQCLIQAAESGDIDQARNALNRGASVNAINETNGDAALILGALNGHKNIVDFLIAHDVSLDVQDQNGDTALMWAVGCAHKSIVEALINAGADVNARSKNGLTALTWAVKNSDEDLVKLFIDQGAQLGSSVEEQLWIKEKNKRLIQSAQLGDVDQTRNALKCGANVNAQNKNDWTALMSAAYMGHIEVVSILLKAGATVDVSNQCVSTVLMFASEKGHTGVVSILLKAGATVDAANQWGSTALMFASEKGHTATVSALLKAGANVNARRKNGSTALMFASENGYAATVSVLLEAGATVDAVNQCGDTALLCAVRKGDADCVSALLASGAKFGNSEYERQWIQARNEMLWECAQSGECTRLKEVIDQGAQLDFRNENRDTTLINVAKKGNANFVEALLKAGASVDAVSRRNCSNGSTALMFAAQKGHAVIVSILLKAGAKVNARRKNGSTALMFASENGYAATVSVLLEAGATVDAVNQYGDTALLCAVRKGDADCVSALLASGAKFGNSEDERQWIQARNEMLWECAQSGECTKLKEVIDQGAQLDFRNENRDTALINVAKKGNADFVEALLKAGASVDAVSRRHCSNGSTALMFAAQKGHAVIVSILLKAGAAVDAANQWGSTALMFAAQKGHAAIASILLEAGANVNAKGKNDDTVLIWAAWRADKGIVEALVKAGADVNAQSKDGLTALSWAVKNSDEDLVKLFIAQGVLLGSSAKEKSWIQEKNKLLIQAAELGDLDQARNALECGANTHIALIIATSNGHKDIIDLLRAHHTSIDFQAHNGRTDLMASAWRADKGIVESLVNVNADVNVRSRSGLTALTWAVKNFGKDVVKLLMSKGAQLESSTEETSLIHRKNKLLITAAQSGDMGQVLNALKCGATVNAQDSCSWTALMYAAQNNHQEIVSELIDQGARVDAVDDRFGNTALIWAAYRGDEDGVKVLVTKLGADVNHQNRNGETALMFAVKKGYQNIIAFLNNEALGSFMLDQGSPPIVSNDANHVSGRDLNLLLGLNRGCLD